jgi:hypothetical protein
MTLEDLAECQAEVIQPIKYEYKAKEGQDGVSLWEVSIAFLDNGPTLMIVPTKWTGSDCTSSPRYHRSPRGRTGDRCTGPRP